jgi:ABC-type multidrug transport system ATPase subunit
MYIRYIATSGDILIIDEPELNLHPKNQRQMARLLAKLVNAGVKIFITTHSDYILKEFNSLIMMKNAGNNAKNVMDKHMYNENELLCPNNIKAFVAKKDLISIPGKKMRKRENTFISAHIGKYGIEVGDFDETIDIMNAIQDDLVLGGM